jgi:hypothetical protein
MKRFFLALVLLAGAVSTAQAQIFTASVRYRVDTPTADETCSSNQPVYCIDSKKICKCDTTSARWHCELATADTLVLGSLDRTSGVCVTSSELGGRLVLELAPCAGGTGIPGLLAPPKYTEADKPICDAALEGVRIYLYPEVGSIAGRDALCTGRTDGSGFDWILGILGNSEAP